MRQVGNGVQKQLYLIDFTLGAMKRRLGRNLALFFVYLLIIFILASVMFFSRAIRQEAAILLQDAPELTVQQLRMGRHELISGNWLEKLSKIRGVQQAEGRLWGYFFDQANDANYTLMVPGKRAEQYEIADGETIVGEGVARARNLRAGSYLFLLSGDGKLTKLKVRQILSEKSALVTTDLVLLSAADYRRFFKLPKNVYTDLALSIRNKREIAKIVEKAARLMPEARFITRQDILRTYESIFSWREGLLLALLGSSLIAFMILAFDKASGLSAEERREIGILKAVGWETSDVIAMKFWEGGLVSLTAFLFGVVLAYFHVFFLAAGLLEPVLRGWAVIYPKFSLTPTLDSVQLASLAFFTILPYTAATIVPVWRAATTDPDEVMR
jgi:ABC-type lipoprotein release transport system permease subunit